MVLLRKLFGDESGADATEYALLAAFIAIAIIVGAGVLGTNLGAFFTALANFIGAIKVA